MSKKSKKSEVAEDRKSAKAIAKHLKISPQKLRIVIDAIRRKPAVKAFYALANMRKKGARLAEKLLKSAVANAKDLGLNEGKLYVSDIRADGGPTMKRFLSRSMGRADTILKRTSHLSLEVTEGNKDWLASTSLKIEEKVEDKGTGKPKKRKTKNSGASKKLAKTKA